MANNQASDSLLQKVLDWAIQNDYATYDQIVEILDELDPNWVEVLGELRRSSPPEL